MWSIWYQRPPVWSWFPPVWFQCGCDGLAFMPHRLSPSQTFLPQKWTRDLWSFQEIWNMSVIFTQAQVKVKLWVLSTLLCNVLVYQNWVVRIRKHCERLRNELWVIISMTRPHWAGLHTVLQHWNQNWSSDIFLWQKQCVRPSIFWKASLTFFPSSKDIYVYIYIFAL